MENRELIKNSRFTQNILGKAAKIEHRELTEEEKKQATIKLKKFIKEQQANKPTK